MLEAVDRIERRLAVVERHLTNAQKLPGQQRELLGTAVMWLKSIWNILNNMDKSNGLIRRWFETVTKTSKDDPLLRFFKSVRDMDLKEGVDGIRGTSVRVRPGARVSSGPDGFTFCWSDINGEGRQITVGPPINMIGSFMGDPHGGGMGYDVRLDDGAITKQYIEVPLECAQVILYYPEAPLEHLGKPLSSKEADKLIGIYHQYWRNVLDSLRALTVQKN